MPKEFFVVAPHRIELREYVEPSLGPGEVRVKSILSGISHGTELNLYRGTTPFSEKTFDTEHRLFVPGKGKLSFPLQLGYEMIGRVVEAAPDVAAPAVGELVHGYLRHRETNVARADALVPVPDGLTPEEAVFLAMGVIALNAVHDSHIKVGDEVVVAGLGVIGLFAVQIARLNGASRVYALDRILRRRAAALNVGADVVLDTAARDAGLEVKQSSHNHGADVAIECSGNYGALQDAMRTVRMGGAVVTLGYYQGGASGLNLGEEWHHNRLEMRSSMGVWGCPHRSYPLWDYQRLKNTVAELLGKRALSTRGFITHEFAFNKAQEAYHLIEEHPEETVKVVLRYDER
jgi:2-desacetyl-2-hydroxyethyl bacteriochlorophyllide A dehydrogenase